MYIDHIFVRAIKYAAGAKYEESVDVKFSAVKSSHSRFWRNLNAGDTAFFEKICVFVVYPNKMKGYISGKAFNNVLNKTGITI